MRHFLATAAFLAATVLSSPAQAVLITYELADLGANEFRYEYRVTNDGSITSELFLFDILFDPLLYDEASLANTSDPVTTAGWDVIFLSSGIGFPAALDALALGAGLGVGEAIAGFGVQFSWLGGGLPSAQPFEIYDLDFNLLGAGTTSLRAVPVPVPEPGTLGLSTLALATLVTLKRKQRRA